MVWMVKEFVFKQTAPWISRTTLMTIFFYRPTLLKILLKIFIKIFNYTHLTLCFPFPSGNHKHLASYYSTGGASDHPLAVWMDRQSLESLWSPGVIRKTLNRKCWLFPLNKHRLLLTASFYNSLSSHFLEDFKEMWCFSWKLFFLPD